MCHIYSCCRAVHCQCIFTMPDLTPWTMVTVEPGDEALKHLHGRYEPAMVASDARTTAQLQEAGYEVRSYAGLLLREPAEVRLEMGSGRWVGHFGTLSPFLRCHRACALRLTLKPSP